MDCNELPPAKGLSKSTPSPLGGQVVIIQASDLAIRITNQPSLAGN